jgi:uncharacterized protein (DUF488 family)
LQQEQEHIIFTIGHSTRTIEEFIAILRSFDIQLLADIRRFPGSKKYPQFNSPSLAASLQQAGIEYIHMPELGGRRKPLADSHNTAWKNPSFRGYADYMETDSFKEGVEKLEGLAANKRVAYMCSEAVWWRCHRSLVSDYLKIRDWKVMHIMDVDKATEHPYTSPAKEVQGKLFY